mmetsp:Transcript_10490/g.29849  ORF Transcript_10490/g.29849 Transcript_10490/m.29849 type:complete len:368 (+) Transcript_10490:342-1445(+)
MSNMPQSCIDSVQVLNAGLSSRVGQRSRDRAGAMLPAPSGGKLHHSLVVSNQLPGGLGGVRGQVFARAVWLKGGVVEGRQGKLPAHTIQAVYGLGNVGTVGVGGTTSELGWEIVHMGVEVAPRPDVRLAALHGLKPAAHCRPALWVPDDQPLVVQKGCHHAFEEGGVVEVHQRQLLPEEERPLCLGKLLVHGIQGPAELVPPRLVAPAAGEPLHPAAEEGALQPVKEISLLTLRTAKRRQQRLLRVALLKGAGDGGGVCYHCPANLRHRDLPGRVHHHEVLWLLPVASHVDLFHTVRDLLLFKLKPNLLAVRAPCSMVPVKDDLRLLSFAKAPLHGVRVGGPVDKVGGCLHAELRLLGGQQLLELLP